MNLHTFHSETSFVTATVDFIISIKPQTVALSGGSTPGPIYKALANGNSSAANFPAPAKSIPGDAFSTHNSHQPTITSPTSNPNAFSPAFYQIDERYVSHTSPDSNYKLITDCGLKLTHFFDTSLSIEKSLAKYAVELPKKLDLIILGIGQDGHIASIFPCQSSDTPSRDGDKTSNRSKKVPSSPLSTNLKTAHTFAPKTSPVKDRLTLTLPYILAAKTILILLKNKPEILKKLKAAEKTSSKSPAKSGTKPPSRPTKAQIADFPALALLKHKHCTIYSLKQ